MKKILVLMAVMLSACGGQKYVQNGSASMSEILKQSIRECGEISDVILVDQCFEFDCNTEKFKLWNDSCNEIIYARKLMSENRGYFK